MPHTRSFKRWLAAGLTAAILGAILGSQPFRRMGNRPATQAAQAGRQVRRLDHVRRHAVAEFRERPAKDLPVRSAMSTTRSTSSGSPTSAPRPTAARSSPTAESSSAPTTRSRAIPRDCRRQGASPSIWASSCASTKRPASSYGRRRSRNSESGRVIDWPNEGICSTPTVEGDHVYYVSNRCEVVCAKVANGSIVWKLDMMKDSASFRITSPSARPLIAGDDLFVVTANGVDEGHINVPAPKAPSFITLDKKSGKVLWQRQFADDHLDHCSQRGRRRRTSSSASSIAAS